jgi:D-alanyl-D-alanine carboxypeptidase (penicillin-binding protein 5/6)
VIVAIFVGVQLNRGLPKASAAVVLSGHLDSAGSRPVLPVPTQGETDVAVEGMGTLAAVQANREVPLGSITKLVSALVVLKHHPLGIGQQGPEITVPASIGDAYQSEFEAHDSVIDVTTGERLSELQCLEAMMIPSADNIADMLALWTAGSQSAFVAEMNAEAASLGLHHTHFADPAGLSYATVGSAADMVRLGEAVLANPLLRLLVAMPQVNLPLAGLVYNFNYDLGRDGIIGIKTGSTPQAGGCFVFAARETIAGQSRLVFGAVLGQYSASSPLQKALNEALLLVQSVSGVAEQVRIVPSGAEVGQVSVPWGKAVPLVTKGSVDLLVPTGATAKLELSAHLPGDTVAAGTKVGTLRVIVGGHTSTVPVVTGGAISPPTVGWRLRRL